MGYIFNTYSYLKTHLLDDDDDDDGYDDNTWLHTYFLGSAAELANHRQQHLPALKFQTFQVSLDCTDERSPLKTRQR